MRRWLVLILLLLLCGAIVNVVVAWACAWKHEQNLQSQQPSLYTFGSFDGRQSITDKEQSTLSRLGWDAPNDDEMFTYSVEKVNRKARGSLIQFYLLQPHIRPEVGHPPAGLMFAPPVFLQQSTCGWPYQSLSAFRFFHSKRATYFNTVVDRVADGTEVGSAHPDLTIKKLIPLGPRWPGFAINTIFYAAILWMMFAFPFVLRRRLRRKRNLCPACAYPIGTSPVCTECGAAVQMKSP